MPSIIRMSSTRFLRETRVEFALRNFDRDHALQARIARYTSPMPPALMGATIS
jgi:hypothetical protein